MIVCILPVCCPEVQGQAQVAGSVSVVLESRQPLMGATVVFQDSDGSSLEATTDHAGDFEISLNAEHHYTVTVKDKSYGTLHRPAFRVEARSHLNLDFITTVSSHILYTDITVSAFDLRRPPNMTAFHCRRLQTGKLICNEGRDLGSVGRFPPMEITSRDKR